MTLSIEAKDLINGKHKLRRTGETINVTGVRGCNIAPEASHLASVLEYEIEMTIFMLHLLMQG
jgi:hypothetical protein